MSRIFTPYFNKSVRFCPFFSVCGLLMFLSEIWKQYCLTFLAGGGAYNWRYFPFQLCSTPMYILLFLPYIKKERIVRACLTFLMSFGLLGGIAVFADTTGLHYPLPALTVHSYLWHILLILIGYLAAIARFSCKLPKAASAFSEHSGHANRGRSPEGPSQNIPVLSAFRSFADAALLYFAFCAAAFCINLVCGRFGTINMFYINPAYPMEQIIFSDLVPALGNSTVILLYMAMTVLGAGILFLFWYLLLHAASRGTGGSESP